MSSNLSLFDIDLNSEKYSTQVFWQVNSCSLINTSTYKDKATAEKGTLKCSFISVIRLSEMILNWPWMRGSALSVVSKTRKVLYKTISTCLARLVGQLHAS